MGNKESFISGAKWTSLETVFTTILSSLNHLVKAIFLSPHEFAYIAIINVVIQTSQHFEDFGFSKAIIQKDKVRNKEITSLFLFSFFAGLLLFALIYFLAPFTSGFFDLPGLHNYLKIASILLILKAPGVVFKATLEREMKFKELVKVRFLNQLISFFLLVFLLNYGYGIMAVVIVQIINVIITSLGFLVYNYKLTDYRLIQSADFKSLKEYIDFGKFVFGRTVIASFTKHIDEILIGYFLSSEVLGFYFFSKSMVEKLKKLIRQSFGNVLYSYLSKIKDKESLFNIYIRIIQILGFFSFPVFIGVAVTSNLFMPLVFGEEWRGGVIFVQAFSLISAFSILSIGTASNLLYSLGKPKLNFIIDGTSDVFYVIFLLIFAQFGVGFVLFFRALKEISAAFFKQFYSMKIVGKNIFEIAKISMRPLFSALLMAVVVISLQLLFKGLPQIILLAATIIFGSAIYFLACGRLTVKVFKDLKRIGFRREKGNLGL